MKRDLAVIAVAALLLTCVIGGAWAWFAGPCELYRFERAADVPARCLR